MKILVAYDGSKVALEALEIAQVHAKTFDAEIFIVRSLSQEPALQKDDVEIEESRVEDLQNRVQKEGIDCKTDVVVSYHSPGEDLVQFAKQNSIDIIFIGVRKRSKVGKLIFGSTAQYVILEAPCPVMTVK